MNLLPSSQDWICLCSRGRSTPPCHERSDSEPSLWESLCPCAPSSQRWKRLKCHSGDFWEAPCLLVTRVKSADRCLRSGTIKMTVSCSVLEDILTQLSAGTFSLVLNDQKHFHCYTGFYSKNKNATSKSFWRPLKVKRVLLCRANQMYEGQRREFNNRLHQDWKWNVSPSVLQALSHREH